MLSWLQTDRSQMLVLENNEPYVTVALTQNTTDVANVKDEMKGVLLPNTLLGYEPSGNDVELYRPGVDGGIDGWL